MLNLKSILKEKTVILCIGNRERGDDGAGPYLHDLLKGDSALFKEKEKGRCPLLIDAGVAPENYTGVILKENPESVIIVDSVLFSGSPGDVRLFKGNELRSGKLSTHDASPRVLIEYLAFSLKSDIYVLGINPHPDYKDFGKEMSKEIKNSVEKLSKELLDSCIEI